MAEALISVLVEQLAAAVYQHTNESVKLVLDADKDVKSFSSKLKAIQAVLEDAEKKQVVEASVADWLEKLKDVSYEMDDVVDEWNTELLRQQVEEMQEQERDDALVTKKKKVRLPSGCFCFGQVTKVIHNRNIAKRIKELNEKLTLIAAERDMYGFHQSTIGGHDDQQLIQRQKTSSLVDISKIYGREEEKEDLLRKLLIESSQEGGNKFLVIPIVGMGGMGKTTFAQLAYNNEEVKTHFDKKVWVCVSDPFDVITVAKAIVESLDQNESQRSSNELETLLLCIRSHVENKKFLLVLDDVWTENQKLWENLKLPEIMQICAEGSILLVTTRKEGVAKMMRATSNMIQLNKLSFRDSLALFNSIAFLDREENGANEFGAIGKEIVKKCNGLPLAVKTLGSLVWYKKTREEWRRDVLDSKIWEIEEVEEQVFRPLLLSYYDLAPAVKMCLLHCVTFPKDYKLEKDKLIELWMSQGYLDSKKNKEKRRNDQNYFESLALRSFFQDFSKNDLGDVYACKMHDIVHDFVQFLSKKESVILEAVEVAVRKDKIRHLTLTSLPEGPLSFPASIYNCKSIRSLIILDSKTTTISPGSILQLKCLRTLNLRGNNMLNELPKEIGELIHLRYMDLSGCGSLKELPEAVCNLYNLQTLDLGRCRKLEKLPKSMGKLINLKHLYVGACWELSYLPKGIGSLKSLQVLDWFVVREGDDDALKLEDLGMMDQLQGSLRIDGLGNNKDDASAIEKAQLGNKEHLSELEVFFQPLDRDGEERKGDSEIAKALQPHPNLESLRISNYHCTTESLCWINSLHNLKKVRLNDWGFCQVLPPLGKLPSLQVLKIWMMKKVKMVGVEFLGIAEEVSTGILFPKLELLSFHAMKKWEEWDGTTKDSSEITIMPRLSELAIRDCPKLKALPDFLYKITALRTLYIEGCSVLKKEYGKGVGKEWHNISHIPNVTTIKDVQWN